MRIYRKYSINDAKIEALDRDLFVKLSEEQRYAITERIARSLTLQQRDFIPTLEEKELGDIESLRKAMECSNAFQARARVHAFLLLIYFANENPA